MWKGPNLGGALGAPGALDFTKDFTNDFCKDPARTSRRILLTISQTALLRILVRIFYIKDFTKRILILILEAFY